MRRPARTASTSEAKLSSSSTSAAASRATSVPRRPIATPMSAALSAGASFTPSPVIATTWPCCCSARTMRSLWTGSTRANTCTSPTRSRSAASSIAASVRPVSTRASPPSTRPAWRAIARAVSAASPRDHQHPDARAPALLYRAGHLLAQGSIKPSSPAALQRSAASRRRCSTAGSASQRASTSSGAPLTATLNRSPPGHQPPVHDIGRAVADTAARAGRPAVSARTAPAASAAAHRAVRRLDAAIAADAQRAAGAPAAASHPASPSCTTTRLPAMSRALSPSPLRALGQRARRLQSAMTGRWPTRRDLAPEPITGGGGSTCSPSPAHGSRADWGERWTSASDALNCTC